MKLELKHLAPYLPYGLKININGMETTLTGIKQTYRDSLLINHSFMVWESLTENKKPILRPLSDLTKEIECNGEKFTPIYKLRKYGFYTVKNDDYFIRREGSFGGWSGFENCESLPFFIIQLFLEWHFDVFGLIDAGLAIDINTLKN